MTLGQKIGIVKHSLSITNARDEKTSITISLDFSTASDSEIKSWLCGSRAIAFQRPTRSLSLAEINELDGTTIPAQDAGKKVKSRQETIDNYTNAGIPEQLSIAIVDGDISSEKMKMIEGILNQE